MLSDKQILVLAEDPMVRHTKQLVLEGAGFSAIGVGSLREVEYVCSRSGFDLAILGRTVSPELKRAAAGVIRGKLPDTPLLELCDNSPCVPNPEYVLFSPSPAELAEKVKSIFFVKDKVVLA